MSSGLVGGFLTAVTNGKYFVRRWFCPKMFAAASSRLALRGQFLSGGDFERGRNMVNRLKDFTLAHIRYISHITNAALMLYTTSPQYMSKQAKAIPSIANLLLLLLPSNRIQHWHRLSRRCRFLPRSLQNSRWLGFFVLFVNMPRDSLAITCTLPLLGFPYWLLCSARLCD